MTEDYNHDFWWLLPLDVLILETGLCFGSAKLDAAIYGSNVREVQLADAEAELRELMKHLTAYGSRKVMSPMETHRYRCYLSSGSEEAIWSVWGIPYSYMSYKMGSQVAT